MPTLWHQSGVNKLGEPFVQLFRDGEVFAQIDPHEAREHARSVLEAAEAAEQDAFILEWGQREANLTFNAAMGLLIEFRKWREAKGKKGPPSNPKEFVITDKHKNSEEADGRT